jgi:hypothetical protein
MLTVTALVLTLVLRALYLHTQVARATLIRRETKGVLSYEVRRRVCMQVIPSHVSEYPVPREERTYVLRFAGVVLLRKVFSIALPAEACTRLGDIPAQEYDGCFPPCWQRGHRR